MSALCRRVGKPKIHHNPKNWNPCLSHVFLNIRSIPYFSTAPCHSLLPYKSRLELHAEPTVPKSLWTHLDIVRECWLHNLSWNILSLKKGFGYWTFGQCKKTHRYLEPWGCPKETLLRDFWENLCRATQQMSLMYGAQIDGSDPSKCQNITEQPPRMLAMTHTRQALATFCHWKLRELFFDLCPRHLSVCKQKAGG